MHTAPPPVVAIRIRDRLDELERPISWLARKLDLEQSHVNRWVKGERRIPANRIPQIAMALGMTEEELCEGTAAA